MTGPSSEFCTCKFVTRFLRSNAAFDVMRTGSDRTMWLTSAVCTTYILAASMVHCNILTACRGQVPLLACFCMLRAAYSHIHTTWHFVMVLLNS
jgi:hypothetical protein